MLLRNGMGDTFSLKKSRLLKIKGLSEESDIFLF